MTHPPRLYLCAAFDRRVEMRAVRALFWRRGHRVLARWIDAEHDAQDDTARALAACQDLTDLRAADAVIAFTSSSDVGYQTGGRHVEVGVALEAGIPVYLVGPRENVFHWHPDIRHFATLAELIDAWGPVR